MGYRRQLILAMVVMVCAFQVATPASATGVPISGFYPMVGTGLTNEFNDDSDTSAMPSSAPSGIMLGQGGTAHYDIALVDTGSAVSLLTTPADAAFNISGPYPGESDGFRGTETIQIGGATGILEAEILDPLGLYAGGLAGRTGTSPF
ncbi:MAG TPA: hypothetical protein VFW73_10060, partial [Lacipirellulaceae bacterium]|nr:hypothetical protein [Lacipirellulaceae bacterium]